MHELASELCREFAVSEFDDVLQALRGSSAGLASFVRQHLGSKEMLLVLVDQLEELFRYHEEADPTGETDDDIAFVKLLLAAAGQSRHPLPGLDDLPIYVVTTIRSEYLGQCPRFRGLPEALNESQYLIPRLTRDQQHDVIEGPIGLSGTSIEPALVQRLLEDLNDNPDQLPALQHALMRTWEYSATAREQGKAITLTDYEAVGGMTDALDQDANEVYESLSSDDITRTTTRRLFQRLVAPDKETRSPTSFSELLAVTAADESDLNKVLDIFKKRGFLTVSDNKHRIVDITHESLIRGWKQLRTWVQEEEESAENYRRLADTAARYSKGEALLFVDPELEVMLNWREKTKPNAAWADRYDSRFTQAMDFLEQSGKQRDKQQQESELRLLRLIGLILPVLALTFGALLYVVINSLSGFAEREENRRLLYDANVFFASDAMQSGQFTLAQARLNESLNEDLRELRGFEWFHVWRAIHADAATLVGHSGAVVSVAFSQDGKTIASASTDKTVRFWETATRKELITIPGDRVLSVASSPNGKALAFASNDHSVKLWDSSARKELTVLSEHSGPVLAIAFSHDGKILASASADQTVKLWDTAMHNVLATLPSHSRNIRSLAFSPDGTLAIAGEHIVRLWNTTTRRELTTITASGVSSVAFSPNGKIFAFTGDDHTVRLWDTVAHKELAPLSGHSNSVSSIVFSPDGNTLASASEDKTVKLWDITARKEVATLSGHFAAILSVAFSPDGKTLASASADNTVKLWDTARVVLGHSRAVVSIAFSHDGQTLASASDETVRLWDTATRTEMVSLLGHLDSVVSITFSPDGKTLASASNDKTVKLWDIATRTELFTLSSHSGFVRSVAFSPDGKTLASASEDNTLRLWDTATGKQVATLSGHSGPVVSVAFTPDGLNLASGSFDNTVKLWDSVACKELVTCKELATLSGHSGFVLSVAFSPDGKTLASASVDKTVKLWDTPTFKGKFWGKPTFNELATLSGHSGTVRSIAFSIDGKTLASVGDDNTVKLWDITSHEQVANLSGHSSFVSSVAFSPDGKALASGSNDKTVRLWLAATYQEVEERSRRPELAKLLENPR